MREPCRHEPQVRRAAIDDDWTDALRQHVVTCADCAAAASSAPFMARFARVDERQTKLPDPSVVRLKAMLLAGNVAADRAARPLNILQMVAYVVVAGGWAAVLTWKWADLQRWLLGFTPIEIAQNMSRNATLSMTFLLAVVVLATMTVMLALHTVLAED
ncbi:MAG TPA: hypothetical protein VLU46_15045 [Thermoanaerobaculia bacterium]|nr:hypothetical protein [Thermoanaerobaculia bacterium]